MLPKLLLAAIAGASSVLAEGFNVTIVYVQPPGGCAAANQSNTCANPPETISISEPPQPGPITTLPPATHWSTCTKCISNLVPKKPEAPCPLYYGNAGMCEYESKSSSPRKSTNTKMTKNRPLQGGLLWNSDLLLQGPSRGA